MGMRKVGARVRGKGKGTHLLRPVGLSWPCSPIRLGLQHNKVCCSLSWWEMSLQGLQKLASLDIGSQIRKAQVEQLAQTICGPHDHLNLHRLAVTLC